MTRSVVFAVAIVLSVLISGSSAFAQAQSPLLGTEFNCSDAQAAFGGGPQRATAGDSVNVALSRTCFLVVSVDIPAGERLEFAYLSGQYDALNIAFYEPTAAAGGAFSDPPNIALGTVGRSLPVPGTGLTTVIVAVQGVGQADTGSATIRLRSTSAAPATTTAPAATTAPATTVAPATTSAPATTATPASTTAPTTTVAPATTATPATTAASANTAAPEADQPVAAAQAAIDDDTNTGDDDGGGLPWWLLTVAIVGAFGWLTVLAICARRPAAPLPWERNKLTWTMQHTAPTGTCSSSARALIDPDDDGTFNGYSITTLFALPQSGKKVRSTVRDPLLAQLEALWATEPTGAELKSAVDAYTNTLCRHLDNKKVPADSTLLTELTKPDVVVHGEVHACVDGKWHMFAGWRDVPELPEGQVQHDIVQVAVLGLDNEADTWLDRADDLSDAIVELIATRSAPAGLWVFD